MSITQHLLELFGLAVIFAGPMPLCLGIIYVLEGRKEKTDEPGFSRRMFIFITGWCILETAVGLLLGILLLLTPTALMVTEIIIFAVGAAILFAVKRNNPSFRLRHLLQPPRAFDGAGKCIILALCFVGLLLLWCSAACPVKDYDSLAYHLPVMAKWSQTGSFTMLTQFKQISRYPYNWEVLCSLSLIPFGDSFSTTLPNPAAWVLFGLSLYLLGLKAGAARFHSLAASSLVLLMPIVLSNVNTLHVDLPFAAFFAAALYLMVHTVHTRSSAWFSLAAAALGMLMGIKTSGLIYGLIPVAVFVILMVKSVYIGKHTRGFSLRPHRTVIPIGAAGGLLFLLLGGYWYLRNLIQLGNPIGFVKVQVANIPVFPGTIEPAHLSKTTLAEVFNPARLFHWEMLFKQLAVKLGIPFLAVIGLVLVLLITFFTRNRSTGTHIFIGLSALSAVTLILYWVTPYSGANAGTGWKITPWFGQAIRYAFPFLGLSGVLAAAGASGVKNKPVWNRVIAAVVLTGGVISLHLLGKHAGVTAKRVLYIGVGLLIMWIGGRALAGGRWTGFRLLVPIVAALIIIGVTFKLRERRETNRRLYYGGIVNYIENHIGEQEVIGYMYSSRSYFFYGLNLDRRVVYALPGNKTFSRWCDMLVKKGVDFVAVGPASPAIRHLKRVKRHLRWMEDPKSPFTRVFGSNPLRESVIYRLKNEQKSLDNEFKQQ